jgi:hypothetical protein
VLRVDRAQTPPDRSRRLEELDLIAGATQPGGADQTREPPSHDDDRGQLTGLRRHRPSHFARPCHLLEQGPQSARSKGLFQEASADPLELDA